jgi:hypothetical protein
MTLTKQDVRNVVDIYIRAWVERDADLIETIFTDTATYHERVFEHRFKIEMESGHTGRLRSSNRRAVLSVRC